MRKEIITHHFVKPADLNHHGTLYAGRTAEWFVEVGLMTAVQYLDPEHLVCAQIHGLNFTSPVHLGETVRLVGRAAYAGTSSLMINVSMYKEDREILSDFMTFVHVDDSGKAIAHHVVLSMETEEEKTLLERALRVRSRSSI